MGHYRLQLDDEVMIVLKGNDKSFAVPLRPLREHSVDTILGRINGLSSATEFKIDSIDLVWKNTPMVIQRGGCASGRGTSASIPSDTWYKEHDKSVVRLINKDNMCLARSLVLLDAYHAGDMTLFKQLRRANRPKLLTEAATRL